MCRRSIHLVCLAFMLGLPAGVANADITTGLVGYYPLDEGAGDTAYDMSGNGHDGTLHNGVTWISQGYIKGAVNVDGTTDTRIELGTWNPAEGTGQLSLALWIRWAGGGGTYQGLIGKRDTWPGTTMFQFQLRPENDRTFRLETGTYAVVSPNGTLPVGRWTHVAASFDGATVSFYINAEMTGSGPFWFGPDTEARVVFGAVEGNGGNPFNGALDEVRIYDRGLTQGQVAWLAGRTTAYTQPLYLLLTPQDGTIDINSDGMIDFEDYAVLADTWLDEVLWP